MVAGYNRSERSNDETYGSPTYAFGVTYNDSLNSLQLMLSQSITDSSMGGGGLLGLDPLADSDSVYKVDQIKRKNASIDWVSNFLCDKCSVNASLQKGTDDYVVLADEIEIQAASLGFSYDLSKRSSFSIEASTSEQKFVGDLFGKDYSIEKATAYYHYKFDGGISLGLFIEQEERDSKDITAIYEEKLIGGELSWVIF